MFFLKFKFVLHRHDVQTKQYTVKNFTMGKFNYRKFKFLIRLNVYKFQDKQYLMVTKFNFYYHVDLFV